MAKKDKAVSPFIHLNQIGLADIFLGLFEVFVPEEVESEIKKHAGTLKAKKTGAEAQVQRFCGNANREVSFGTCRV